jgi:hypothetical protein
MPASATRAQAAFPGLLIVTFRPECHLVVLSGACLRTPV